MDASLCPVCEGENLKIVPAATGSHAYCTTCFHGFRPAKPDYSYQSNMMCGLGTSEGRLESQCRFITPHIPAGGQVLEIGCATGELSQAVQARAQVGRYEAIELSKAGEVARGWINPLYNEPLRHLLADGVVGDDRYDMIIMSHVLEHIDEISAEVAAMARVLKPDGAMFIEVPHGAGNRALPVDDNISHLHFFSLTSLPRLLARHGLNIVDVETGARLDARYADSLRVIARPFAPPRIAALNLAEHPALASGALVVWGAGSLASELLANFLPAQSIDYFIDRDPTKHGTTLMGRPVRAPDALNDGGDRVVLINSIDFAPAIAEDIDAMFPGHRHALVRIGDVIDDFRNQALAAA